MRITDEELKDMLTRNREFAWPVPELSQEVVESRATIEKIIARNVELMNEAREMRINK